MESVKFSTSILAELMDFLMASSCTSTILRMSGCSTDFCLGNESSLVSTILSISSVFSTDFCFISTFLSPTFTSVVSTDFCLGNDSSFGFTLSSIILSETSGLSVSKDFCFLFSFLPSILMLSVVSIDFCLGKNSSLTLSPSLAFVRLFSSSSFGLTISMVSLISGVCNIAVLISPPTFVIVTFCNFSTDSFKTARDFRALLAS